MAVTYDRGNKFGHKFSENVQQYLVDTFCGTVLVHDIMQRHGR